MNSFRSHSVANSVAMVVTKSMRLPLRIKREKNNGVLVLGKHLERNTGSGTTCIAKEAQLEVTSIRSKDKVYFCVNAFILNTSCHVLSKDILYESPRAHWLSSGY